MCFVLDVVALVHWEHNYARYWMYSEFVINLVFAGYDSMQAIYLVGEALGGPAQLPSGAAQQLVDKAGVPNVGAVLQSVDHCNLSPIGKG